MVDRTSIEWINKHTNFISREFIRAINDACFEWLQDEIKPDLESATSTWKHQPRFSVNKKHLDITTSSKRFHWVNHGTSVRYARLSKNWESKSTPGSLKAGYGAGRVLKRVHKPYPGIKPRDFGRTSAEKRAPQIPRIFTKHIVARAARIWK